MDSQNLIKENIKQAVSAGGVVVRRINKVPHILLIRDKHYNDWVLPKGHQEPDETLEETAKREVLEEARIDNVGIIKPLGVYKRFVPRANENKTIHYFLMKPDRDFDIKKDLSTGTDEIAWHPIDNLPSLYLEEQKDVIEKNLQIIKDLAE